MAAKLIGDNTLFSITEHSIQVLEPGRFLYPRYSLNLLIHQNTRAISNSSKTQKLSSSCGTLFFSDPLMQQLLQ
jgi:hypothetical protein